MTYIKILCIYWLNINKKYNILNIIFLFKEQINIYRYVYHCVYG